MPLQDVLHDATLASADPIVRAGASGLSQSVRWVHTSEVLQIAELLRGGELLLVGGVALAGASPAERCEYVRELAARGVAGLAVETGSHLPRLPDEMVSEAERLTLPLIELRRVVRFVEVTEAINGRIVNESVRRLQLADRVSHALLAALVAGGDLERLVSALAAATQMRCELQSLSGEVLVSAPPEDAAAGNVVATAPVTGSGVTVAMLVLYPAGDTDPALVQAALERAPEPLALAWLRSRPLSQAERDARELLMLATSGTHTPRRLEELAGRLGIAAHGPFVTVAARLDWSTGGIRQLELAMRSPGRSAISQVQEGWHLSVVALGGMPLPAGRAALLKDLRAAHLPAGMSAVVGPGCRNLAGIQRCMRHSTACLQQPGLDRSPVLDAADVGVERLVVELDRHRVLAEFIDEQLGDLREADRGRGVLFSTLHAYLRQWGSKTATAEAMHLQRQSLYQRLERIFAVIGDVPAGSPRLGALLVAVELEAARRNLED